jgi:hypothetical protein
VCANTRLLIFLGYQIQRRFRANNKAVAILASHRGKPV